MLQHLSHTTPLSLICAFFPFVFRRNLVNGSPNHRISSGAMRYGGTLLSNKLVLDPSPTCVACVGGKR